MPAGRPPIPFDQDHADILCEAIATSSKSLAYHIKTLRAKDDNFPCIVTIYRWLRENDEFANLYARAKEDQADFLADESIEIADDDSLDVGFTDEGKPFVKGENIQRARLRVETRKWLTAKLRPKKYGDKIEQTFSNPDGTALNMTVNFVAPPEKAEDAS